MVFQLHINSHRMKVQVLFCKIKSTYMLRPQCYWHYTHTGISLRSIYQFLACLDLDNANLIGR